MTGCPLDGVFLASSVKHLQHTWGPNHGPCVTMALLWSTHVDNGKRLSVIGVQVSMTGFLGCSYKVWMTDRICVPKFEVAVAV